VRGEDRRVDVVVDCFGGRVLEEAWWVVKEGGTVVSIFEEPEGRKPEGCEVGVGKSLFFVMGSDGGQLGRVTELVEQGVCRPAVDWVVPFGEFERGFERVASGGTRGKVVLDLEGE
jgi:NADPH:quinone reductase-like Zn-dependent oxidoreductase